MNDQPLRDQFSELVSAVGSVGSSTGRLVRTTVSLSWRSILFVISCGSLVRWRRSTVPMARTRSELNPLTQKAQSHEVLPDPSTPNKDFMKRSWSMFSDEREDIIMIPSHSIDPSKLLKIEAVALYEERQLNCLFYLRNPNARVVFVSGNPIDLSIVEYYLNLLADSSDISVEHARKRMLVLNCNDISESPLSSKILERPRLIQKIKSFIDPRFAYMTCFMSSNLEKELATQLGVTFFANDPDLSYWGSKAGSRMIFEEAGILLPTGTPLAYSLDALSEQIAILYRQEPANKIVVKLNVGFSGEGNAILRTDNFKEEDLENSISIALTNSLEFTFDTDTWDSLQVFYSLNQKNLIHVVN